MNPPLLPRISDYAAWQASHLPQGEAFVIGEKRMSFSALDDDVEALARALLGAGVRKGDRIAALQTPHPDAIVNFLAAASIGAIWVGLNPRYRVEELLHVVSDAAPVILFARTVIEGRDYMTELGRIARECASLRRIVALDDPPAGADVIIETYAHFLSVAAKVGDGELDAARQACGGRDPCLLVYTSGSTGKPKGALLQHEGISRFCLDQNRLWPVSALRMVNYFPINHVGSLIDVTLPGLVAGGTTIFMEQFDPAACLALMVRERVTIWGSVPSVFHLQLALPDFASYDLSAIELILWEGAAMPAELIERLRSICPRLATNYGMTETTSAITIVEPTDDVEILSETVGGPFPGVEIRLVDEHGAIPPPGVPGEVQTRSALNFLGYWGNPQATADAFTEDGFFRTGDLAILRPDGRYRIVGRLKEMFKSGGYNVYPREVEIALEAHPSVALVAVVSTPDPVWQEIGVAYVVACEPVTPEALEQYCRSCLANYKIPKRFVIETELPLLPIGKIDKPALQRRAAECPA
jgi:acyl-CoA synthetase (AMP-forming)/AMP-acid ligase II